MLYNPKDGILSSGFVKKVIMKFLYALIWYLWKIDLYIKVEKHEWG